MAYSNSKLATYTKISPNRTSPRNHAIDRVSVHCVVGQMTVESLGGWFAQTAAQSSCNYGIGTDGRIALVVEEKDRSWCTSSSANDNRAVTIECASDKTHPYAVNAKVYEALIDLLTDICRRNGKKKLLWFGDKDKTLAYAPKPDEMVMTVHRWFAAKECPGQYLYDRHGQIAAEVTRRLGGNSAGQPATEPLYRVRRTWTDVDSQLFAGTLAGAKKACLPGYSVYDENGKCVYTEKAKGLQAADLRGLTEAQKIEKIAPLYQAVARKTGMLASVGLAQFCLESGYGTTDLAEFANNLHGMKCSLSGNSWQGSAWDGKSKYTKNTKEQTPAGQEYTVKADFRKYACCEDSIADRAAYFIGAKNGAGLRYPGINQITDYREQIRAIKAGGYATDVKYVDKLCELVERWHLDRFDDAKPKKEAIKTRYIVQVGLFVKKVNATSLADKLKGKGFDAKSVKQDDGQYRVQAGKFEIRANAEGLVAMLKQAGFSAKIIEK